MTISAQNVTNLAVFRRLRALLAAAAVAALAAPGVADARLAARGVWNVVFATTWCNCSSGYSVPFTVAGSRVSSAGGGKVEGQVNRAGSVAVRVKVGASHASGSGAWSRDHFRRPLQRNLAGDTNLNPQKA